MQFICWLLKISCPRRWVGEKWRKKWNWFMEEPDLLCQYWGKIQVYEYLWISSALPLKTTIIESESNSITNIYTALFLHYDRKWSRAFHLAIHRLIEFWKSFHPTTDFNFFRIQILAVKPCFHLKFYFWHATKNTVVDLTYNKGQTGRKKTLGMFYVNLIQVFF